MLPTSSRQIMCWLTPSPDSPTMGCYSSVLNFYVILICAARLSTVPALDQLCQRQQGLLHAALAPTTRRSHLSQMNCYFDFCDCYGLVSFPCSSEQACLYAAFLSEWMAPTSIINYLSAVWYRQRTLGYESHASSFILHQTIRGLRLCYTDSPSHRYPLSLGDLRLIFTELNPILPLDLVFWAATSLAFRALLRKCHYTVSRHSLLWSDLNLYPDHLVLIIRSSKTDQFSLKPHRIVINSSPGSDLCPVKWLYALARAHKPRDNDYIFRAPGPVGLSRITCNWFNFRLKQLASKIGLDPTCISSHSLGCDIADIRARGSWASSAIFRYLHHSEETLRMKDTVISEHL